MKRFTIFEDEAFLRQRSKEFDFTCDDLDSIIKTLKAYCKENAVYALAPVQIGIPKRIIYIKNSHEDMTKNRNSLYDEEIVYINPVIKKACGLTRFFEGCESCSIEENNIRIYYNAIIERPYQIVIEYQDKLGNKCAKTLKGFEATVFCHEYDHLNGIVHLDKASDVLRMNNEEVFKYRSAHPYEVLDKKEKFNL